MSNLTIKMVIYDFTNFMSTLFHRNSHFGCQYIMVDLSQSQCMIPITKILYEALTRKSRQIFAVVVNTLKERSLLMHKVYSPYTLLFYSFYKYMATNNQVGAILIKTGLNNIVLPTLFTVVNSIVNNIVTPDSGSTISFNIVDKCEQCGQHNIL